MVSRTARLCTSGIITEPDKGGDQKPDPEIHDRLNHLNTPPTQPSPAVTPMKP